MLVRLSTVLPVRPALRTAALAALALSLASCDESNPTETPPARATPTDAHLTMGSGSTRTFLGQATYADIDKVKRISSTHDWQVEVKAKGGLEILVQTFDYAPGAITGWHKHPGPVFIQVIQGTVTFYEADDPTCTPITVSAGHGYLDRGDGHIGRNLSGAPAKDITVYLAPPGTTPAELRIDMPVAPPQCGF
jgi:quercetin dioxygenase-like cupin family protein